MRWKPPLLTLNRRVPRLPYKTKCKKKKSPDELRGNMGLTVFFEVLLNPRPASWRSCSTPHPPTAPRGWRRAPGRAGPGLQPAAGTPRPPPRSAGLAGSTAPGAVPAGGSRLRGWRSARACGGGRASRNPPDEQDG